MRDDALFMRPAEVARLLGLSTSRVYHLLSTNRIPSSRFGKRRVIPRAAFEKWLAQHEANAVASVRPAS